MHFLQSSVICKFDVLNKIKTKVKGDYALFMTKPIENIF